MKRLLMVWDAALLSAAKTTLSRVIPLVKQSARSISRVNWKYALMLAVMILGMAASIACDDPPPPECGPLTLPDLCDEGW